MALTAYVLPLFLLSTLIDCGALPPAAQGVRSAHNFVLNLAVDEWAADGGELLVLRNSRYVS